jgi:hypothetical protein
MITQRFVQVWMGLALMLVAALLTPTAAMAAVHDAGSSSVGRYNASALFEEDDDEACDTEDGEDDEGNCSEKDTVLLLHNYTPDADSTGQRDAVDCQSYWNVQRATLLEIGHTGEELTVGYYSDNVNCDRNLASTQYSKDGNPRLEDAPSDPTLLTTSTSLRHVAYRFAWLAAETYKTSGKPIRVIADGMGGLIVRWAIAESSLGNPNYPRLSEMAITRVYTYGTPFYGTDQRTYGNTEQARQSTPGSSFLTTLNSGAFTRVGSAKWYAFTSTWFDNGDGYVSDRRACWEKSTVCFRYENPAYQHAAYRNDRNRQIRSDAFRLKQPLEDDEGGWSRLKDGPGAPAVVADLVVYDAVLVGDSEGED